MMRPQTNLTTLGCGAIAAILFGLWMVLADDRSLDTIITGAVVAAAAAVWVRLIDG